MRMFVPTLAVLASLTACGGGEEEDASSKVFKSMGTLQCSGGGVSLAALQAQLAAAKVLTRSAACGTDGLANSTVCGSPDGRIGIFEISPTQAGAAAAAGFAPLSTLPTARTIPCA
ncbi:MAG: hypothetical protein JWP72_4053 [Massilia sp.]|nr:hypothetical protein [Massilia sp.]